MMERLRHAHNDFFSASPENKKAALQHYLTTLIQFNALLSRGELPPTENGSDGHAHGGPETATQ